MLSGSCCQWLLAHGRALNGMMDAPGPGDGPVTARMGWREARRSRERRETEGRCTVKTEMLSVALVVFHSIFS